MPILHFTSNLFAQYLLKAHFGLEGNMFAIRRDHYERIVAHDCPGANRNVSKAAKMRSFIVPEDLTIPYARNNAGSQTLVIMAAVVCEHVAFVFVDFSRMIRFDIIRLNRDWVPSDLVPGSPVCFVFLSPICHCSI